MTSQINEYAAFGCYWAMSILYICLRIKTKGYGNVLLLALVNFAVLKLLMFTETYYLFTVRFDTCTRDGGMNIYMVLSVRRFK